MSIQFSEFLASSKELNECDENNGQMHTVKQNILVFLSKLRLIITDT